MTEWYYYEEDKDKLEKLGPYTKEQLQELAEQGVIRKTTFLETDTGEKFLADKKLTVRRWFFSEFTIASGFFLFWPVGYVLLWVHPFWKNSTKLIASSIIVPCIYGMSLLYELRDLRYSGTAESDVVTPFCIGLIVYGVITFGLYLL